MKKSMSVLAALLLAGAAQARTPHGAAPSPASAPPVPRVCVEDPVASAGMRPSDAVVRRLAGDSALGADGERRGLSEFRPRIVGYAAGPQALDEPTRPGAGVRILGSDDYVRFGLPRALPPGSPYALVRIGEARGASVFIAPGGDVLDRPGVLYVLLPDCTFQPYMLREYTI